MAKKASILFIGCVISVAMLVIFWGFKQYKAALLDIDAKWLIAAGVPIVIALIVGGYISKFKFSGMELEVASQKEVDDPSLMTVLKTEKALNKESLSILHNTPQSELNNVTVLSFILRKRQYYDSGVVLQYLRRMPNLKYFEFVDKSKAFVGLTRIDRILYIEDDTKIKRLIEDIEHGDWREIGTDFIDETINHDKTIMEAYELMRLQRKEKLAVLNNTRLLLGIVTQASIEKFLASQMLQAWKAEKK